MNNTVALALEDSLLDSHDLDGNSAAHRAVHRGDLLLLQALMNEKHSFLPNDRKETPLHWACRRGCPMMVELLLQKNEADAKDDQGRTPVQWALNHHQSRVVPLLLRSLSDEGLRIAIELAEGCEGYPWEETSRPVPFPTPPKRTLFHRYRSWLNSL